MLRPGLSFRETRAGDTARRQIDRGTLLPPPVFTAGEAGAWYDPSDLETAFQDAAGTVSAGEGDPVGRLNDISGNGHDAVQSVSASRPALQRDGNGRFYLDFDGVDDWLEAPGVALGGAATATMATAFETRTPVNSAAPILVWNEFADRAADAPLLTIQTSSPTTGDAIQAILLAIDNQGTGAVPITSPDRAQYTVLIDLPLAGSGEIALRRNGAAAAAGQAGKDSGGTGFASAALAIGASVGGSNPFHGRFYGGLLTEGRLTGSDLAAMESWLMNKARVIT